MIPKKLKNQLLEIVLKAELNPGDFAWEQNDPAPTIRSVLAETLYRRGAAEFRFTFHTAGLALSRVNWFPDSGGRSGTSPADPTVFSVFQAFSEWLNRIKEHFETPDLWTQYTEYEQLGAEDGLVELGNEQFSVPQAERVIQAIAEIKGLLEESGKITEANRDFVEQRLRHLEESVKRLGKKDYFTLAVGTMVTISTALTLDPARAKVIWGVLQVAIQGAARLLPGM